MSKTSKKELARARVQELYSTLFPQVNCDLDALAPQLERLYPGGDSRVDETPITFFCKAQEKALFSKSAFLPGSDEARTARALQSWREAEDRCRLTNHRFRHYWRTGKWSGPAGPLLSGISRRVVDMMGEPPKDIYALKGRHGPGSTVSLRGDCVSAADKFAEQAASATPALADYIFCTFGEFAEAYPLYADCLCGNIEGAETFVGELKINEVPYSRFTTVFKNFKTKRAIDVQATLNQFFQLGIGDLLRGNLRRARKVDLDTQADVNRFRVSHDSTCATVDLTGASDHKAHNLVVDLVSPCWLEILDLVRTPTTRMADGSLVGLQKWSAMGNGYTFELETIIFKAIAEEVTNQVLGPGWDSQVLAFGDDLIVPEQCGPMLVEVLRDLGFVPNAEKTFLTGRFKESCGVDIYFHVDGPVNVRPTYLRAKSLTETEDLIGTFNALTRALSALSEVCCRSDCGVSPGWVDACGRDLYRRLSSARCLVLSWIPYQLRLVGPAYLGDVVIHVPESEWAIYGFAPKENKHGLTRISTWAPEPPKKRLEDYPPNVQMCTALYGQQFTLGKGDYDHYLSVRGRPRYSVRRVPVVLASQAFKNPA